MTRLRSITRVFNIVLLSLIQMPATAQPVSAIERPLVVISDLHIGLGRDAAGKWIPTEDFRWTGALQGFLAQISRDGKDQVDLVIAGDLLELWQRPDDIKCTGDGPIGEISCIFLKSALAISDDLKLCNLPGSR